MRKSRAVAVWGEPDGRCRRIAPYDPDDLRRGCAYGGFIKTSKGVESGPPFAGFTFLPSGEVTSVWLSLTKYSSAGTAVDRYYRLAAAKARRFKTARTIRLRSTMQAARRAYGLPTPRNVPSDRQKDILGSVIVRQRDACTVFGWSGSNPLFTYIDTIEVAAAAWCPKDPEPVAPEES
jgi:hypothetical protein